MSGPATSSPLEVVLAALPPGRKVGGQVRTICPAHPDRRPSLGIRELPDGRVLIRCYAGCSTDAVLEAIDLDFSDLFPEDGRGLDW